MIVLLVYTIISLMFSSETTISTKILCKFIKSVFWTKTRFWGGGQGRVKKNFQSQKKVFIRHQSKNKNFNKKFY